ncbi:MAG: hypothetical protein ABIU05_09090 [Nitrospirales bacterium]
MLIEARVPLAVRCLYGVVHLVPGVPAELADADALRLLAKAPGQVRAVESTEPPRHDEEGGQEVIDLDQPVSPLQPGWSVTYRDTGGRLCGGADDRGFGTVKECRWHGNGWTVELTDGRQLHLSRIRAVGRTDSTGKIVAAWTVRSHGYNGEKNP